MTNLAAQTALPDEDRMRADLYDFLGSLLARPPSAELLQRTAALEGDGTPIGVAIGALAKIAAKTGPATVEREFNDLFIGLGRGELVPYASYYMTGFLNERPLALLRGDMADLQITRSAGVFEPEDGIASLMEMMAGLIAGRFGAPADLATQRQFFNRHIAPWAKHFFTDLQGAKMSVLYAPVGALGAAFIDVETEAFRLADGG